MTIVPSPKRTALIIFCVYCIDLILKLPDFPETLTVVGFWGMLLALSVRFTVMGFLLWC